MKRYVIIDKPRRKYPKGREHTILTDDNITLQEICHLHRLEPISVKIEDVYKGIQWIKVRRVN